MAQCPMNGKLDITECDNPVLSHRVAQCSYRGRGFGPTLCRFNILHIYLFIFYRPGNRRYLTFERPPDIFWRCLWLMWWSAGELVVIAVTPRPPAALALRRLCHAAKETVQRSENPSYSPHVPRQEEDGRGEEQEENQHITRYNIQSVSE